MNSGSNLCSAVVRLIIDFSSGRQAGVVVRVVQSLVEVLFRQSQVEGKRNG